MKQKTIVVVLIVSILLVIGIDLLFVGMKEEKETGHYSCIEEKGEQTETYQMAKKYEFRFANGEITEAEITESYFFVNEDAYNSFSYPNSTEVKEASEIEGSLEKRYRFDKSIPTNTKKLKNYLQELKKMNYDCQLIEENAEK